METIQQTPTELEKTEDREVVMTVRNVHKKFCLKLKRSMYYGILDLTKNLFGMKPDNRSLKQDEFWALEDINFNLHKGETLGIVGLNGSGKTTLLRVLNGIFPPDSGEIMIKGRVGGLIAVGAGFHPHMTGHENIFLNGTILGMTKDEIDAKMQSIIQFADIGNFLEAPVSTYSSGMKVRLGFSIAIHGEPEVLLVDEVLAVGDLSFKKKCMQKLQELKKNTSTIFISHNMAQVERICDRVLILDHGKVLDTGGSHEMIVRYSNLAINNEKSQLGSNLKIVDSTGDIKNLNLKIRDAKDEEQSKFQHGDDIAFDFSFTSLFEFIKPILGVVIENSEGIIVAGTNNLYTAVENIKAGENRIVCKILKIPLLSGNYKLHFKWKLADNTALFEAYSQTFSIAESTELAYKYYGTCRVENEWKQS